MAESIEGRAGPHNACCYRHLCRAETAAYLQIAQENERLFQRCRVLSILLYPNGAPREAIEGDI